MPPRAPCYGLPPPRAPPTLGLRRVFPQHSVAPQRKLLSSLAIEDDPSAWHCRASQRPPPPPPPHPSTHAAPSPHSPDVLGPPRFCECCSLAWNHCPGGLSPTSPYSYLKTQPKCPALPALLWQGWPPRPPHAGHPGTPARPLSSELPHTPREPLRARLSCLGAT